MTFFKNRLRNKLKDILIHSVVDHFTWVAVTWNLNLEKKKLRTLGFDLQGVNSLLLQWHRDQEESISFSTELDKNKKLIFDSSDKTEFHPILNLKTHEVIASALEEFKEFVLTPVSGVTALDFQEEQRYLEWLKTTFKVLNSALDKIQADKDLILTAGFFSGIEPQSGKKVVRILAMNLDVFYYFEEDFSLKVVVFNDKNLGHGSAQSPVFHQNIKVTKPQFYDEIIKVVNKIAVVGEIE